MKRPLPKGSPDVYDSRRLSQGFPGIDKRYLEQFAGTQSERSPADERRRLRRLLLALTRIVDVPEAAPVLEVGCGPRPLTLEILNNDGLDARGVEPVPYFVETARTYLGDEERVLLGSAESLPLPDESQHIVVMEAVLEHVDSPDLSLGEAYRVLRPGGALYISTTNRLRLYSLVGCEAEFTVRFYGWLPQLVKESYVFLQLHYRPELANYTVRPAVHWFSYASLCDLGRRTGFHSFYSPVDTRRLDDSTEMSEPWKQWIRRRVLPLVQTNAWVRSLWLTQNGHEIIMLKRA